MTVSKYLVMWATDHPAPVTMATGSLVPSRLIRSGNSFGISVLQTPLPGEQPCGSGRVGDAFVRRGVHSHPDVGLLEGCGQDQRNGGGQPAAGSGRGRAGAATAASASPQPLLLTASRSVWLAWGCRRFPKLPEAPHDTSPAPSGALPVTPRRGTSV